MTADRKNGSRHGGRFSRNSSRREAADLAEIFFCGDPHGEFSQIIEAARDYKPAAMVILGDLQPAAPLEEVLEEAMAFTDIWWIPGNHDTDSDEIYDNLWKSPLASHNLHGRVGNVAGLRIAGLGGVFRGQIWMPDGRPNYTSVGAFMHRVGKNNTWRGGLPRRHRSSIFPSVYDNLARQRADILVTHEAPSCHRKGFAAIDRLAMDLNVRWLFHGHQHEGIAYGRYSGIQVRSVGLRGIVNLRGEEIVESQVDPKDAELFRSRGDAVLQTEGDNSILVFPGKVPAERRCLDGKIIAQPWRDQTLNRPKNG